MHSTPVHAVGHVSLPGKGCRLAGDSQEMDHCHNYQLSHGIHQNPSEHDRLEGELSLFSCLKALAAPMAPLRTTISILFLPSRL